MTAEFVLLLTVYGFLIVGIFAPGKNGLMTTFKNTLPMLSARIERNIICGKGFEYDWSKPTSQPPLENPWGF